MGIYAEVEADLLVAALQGSSIPAMRLPANQPISVLFTRRMPGTFPISVYVPPERAEAAAELYAEQPRQSIPQPVRAVGQWYLVAHLATMLGSALTFGLHGASEHAAHLAGALAVIGTIAVLWRGMELIAVLRRERRCFPDAAVLVVAVLTWGVLSVLVYPLMWASQSVFARLDSFVVTMVVASFALIAVLLTRRRHQAESSEDESSVG
jgi:hypothetical protein